MSADGASSSSGAARPLLSTRGLVKRFGAVVAAEGVNIDVPAGQRLSVIGSNGAGKTTFVNMVTGYLRPDEGAIELDGHDITRLGHRRIAGLGLSRSFQIPQLCLELTLRQTYRNTSDRVLEVVYTFPLPLHAVLLGFGLVLLTTTAAT